MKDSCESNQWFDEEIGDEITSNRLQRFIDNEVGFRLEYVPCTKVLARLGDEMNGFYLSMEFKSVGDALGWLKSESNKIANEPNTLPVTKHPTSG